MKSKSHNRYQRHFHLPNFSEAEQQKLTDAKVLVVGAGGLGAPLLQYLTAAGVGTIGIVDFDRVEESNLHRQILFGDADLGKLKVEVAIQKLKAHNPFVEFVSHTEKLTSQNAFDIISKYDVVADGTDNFPTRYLVNDACVILGKTNVYASIFRYEGQVSVFNYLGKKKNPNYRDLHPNPPSPGTVPNCAEAGVLGVLPGIIGAMQANEVIKVITGIGEPLVGKLFVFDALTMQSRKIGFEKVQSQKPITELIDYDEFCGIRQPAVDSISKEGLKAWLNAEYPFLLVDVRTEKEHVTQNIGGVNIPFNQLDKNLKLFEGAAEVVVYCHSGFRSGKALEVLKEKFPNQKFYNLKGGIEEWY